MIIWHGMWTNSIPPSYYRISIEDGKYVIEHRRNMDEQWGEQYVNEKSTLIMAGWYGMTKRYDNLELLP